jgi:hypothetical protein
MTYIAELYRPASGVPALPTDPEIESTSAALRGEGRDVVYLGCVSIPGDEMTFYLFEAPSADAVREVLRRMALDPERIVDAAASGFAGGR